MNIIKLYLAWLLVVSFAPISFADVPSIRCVPGQDDNGINSDQVDKLPELLVYEEPQYPEILRNLFSVGEVVLLFTVNKEGVTKDIHVLESQHPGFEDSTVAAFLKAKFKPAEKSGQPVDSCVKQAVEYRFGSLPTFVPPQIPGKPYTIPAFDIFDIISDTKQPFDEPPKIKLAVAAVYPFEMMSRKQKGTAKVTFTIGTQGDIVQAAVVEASHPDFGLAAQAMIEAWKFEPAQKAGKKVSSVLTKEHTFSMELSDADNATYSEGLVKAIAANRVKIYSQNELDALPEVKYKVMPVYPLSLLRSSKTGDATLEFFVDQAGKVQWPRIMSASQPEFGWAAATAVKRWIFDVPKKDGKPVNARFVLPFDFKIPEVTQHKK